jgi:hypothetical protein
MWLRSGGAGKAMLRSALVSSEGQSGNSWRARQSWALLRPSPTPHASYRTKEVGDGVGVEAQETVMEARDNYKRYGCACRPKQKPRRSSDCLKPCDQARTFTLHGRREEWESGKGNWV